MLPITLAISILASNQAVKPDIVTGVWYEGGVGEFRQNLIPQDPALAAPLYLRNFKDIAAHSINVVVAPNSPPEHHRPILDAADKANVKLILELGPEGAELGSWIRGKDAIDPRAIASVVDKKLRPIATHSALLRVQLLDEPWPEIFDRYAKVAEVVQKTKPPFCCLIEAGNVESFLTKTKSDVVAFDSYPLGVNVPVGDPAALGHFKDVAQQAATVATKHGARAWAVLQCHAITGGLRFPTPGELRWMTHVSLGTGCKGVFWFLYQTEWLNPGHTAIMDGLVDPDYRERPLWSEVGRLARRIHSIESTIAKLKPVPLGKDVVSNGTVMELADFQGARYLYLVNPDVRLRSNVDLRFTEKVPDGLSPVPLGQKVDRVGEAFQLRMDPGDGVLLRVKT